MASVEVELSCSMCRGFFRDLLPLTCGHSFCHSCLEDNWREQGCTLCRHSSSIEPSPPNVAPRNISEDLQFTDDSTDGLLQDDNDIFPSSPADLRIVLVGKTGSGKSASGNIILGTKSFESKMTPKSVTKECQIDEVISEENTISVTDTPGVYDTELGEEALRHELESCIYMTAPGPHVFLLVIRVGVRYNREEKDAVQWICEHFGEESLRYAIVLFTHTDELKDMTLEQYVDESDDLKKLIRDCGGRFHGFNNKDTTRTQVTGLLQKINGMVGRNRVKGGEHYTNKEFQEAQKQIKRARMIKYAKEVAIGGLKTAVTVALAEAAGAGEEGVTGAECLLLPALFSVGGAVATAVSNYVIPKKTPPPPTHQNECKKTE